MTTNDLVKEENYDEMKAEEIWIDDEAGLMWEVDIKTHKYVRSKEYTEEAFVPKELTDDVKDIFSYVHKLNILNYGGFSDWRIPTFEELETILMEEANNYGFYLPESLSHEASFYYWSKTTYDEDPSEAWAFNFYDGGVYSNEKKEGMAIMCVRGSIKIKEIWKTSI